MPKPPSKSRKKLTFAVPEGLDLEGKREGDELELVAVVTIEPDGKLCLKSVNGIELPEYSAEEKDEKSPKNFAEAVTGDSEEGY